MAGIVKQIIGSFEDIGEKVVQEVKQVPKDVAGKAMESLGVSSSSKTQTSQQQIPGETKLADQGPMGQIDQTKDINIKKAIARAALEQLSGRSKPKEPSIWEQKQQEEAQKKENEKKQAEQASKAQLPKISGKRKAGDLYGVNAKRAAAEKKIGNDT